MLSACEVVFIYLFLMPLHFACLWGFCSAGSLRETGCRLETDDPEKNGKAHRGMDASQYSVPTTQPRNTCSDEELDMFSPKMKTKNSMVFSNKYTTQLFPKLELGLKIPMFFLICMNKIHFHGHHTQGSGTSRNLITPFTKYVLMTPSL